LDCLSGLASLNVAELQLHVDDVKKCGFRAKHIRIEHPEQKAHRHLHHIEAMIEGDFTHYTAIPNRPK
jgi:uncharacterized protein (DUF111 family)